MSCLPQEVCVVHMLTGIQVRSGQKSTLMYVPACKNAINLSMLLSLCNCVNLSLSLLCFYTAGKREFVENMNIESNLAFSSACGYPSYTNFVPAFNGCLDYIYIDSTLQTERVIPLPSHEDVTQNIALPNRVFPSDHLALVCDLTWADMKGDGPGREPPRKRNKMSWLNSIFRPQ